MKKLKNAVIAILSVTAFFAFCIIVLVALFFLGQLTGW
jgi:hypothetical protein